MFSESKPIYKCVHYMFSLFVYSMNVFDMGKILCESDGECVKSDSCIIKYVGF